jgi:hypothetical protein
MGDVEKTNGAVRSSHQYRTEKKKEQGHKKSDADIVHSAFKKSSTPMMIKSG